MAAPAAVVDPVVQIGGADGGESSLPDGKVIVPGAAVELALRQIADAQNVLRAQTWGSGDVVAGLVSIVPQVFLAEAAWSLSTWQATIETAKSAVADTVGVPLIHELAALSLMGSLLLPSVAQIALEGAGGFVPLVGIFGAPAAAAQASGLIGEAKQNGQVYAVRLMRTVEYSSVFQGTPDGTRAPIIYLSVNGGPVAPVLMDTGSAGLTILNGYVGQQNLGEPTGHGESSYGDDTISVSYDWTSYQTTLDFGFGAVTAPGNVRVVDSSSQAIFGNYGLAALGMAGVLGVGANNGTGPTLNALLPGEFGDGVLFYQNIIGPFGLAVFGPNPLPSRASVPGAPVSAMQVQIDDGPLQALSGLIDSGAASGTLPSSVAGVEPGTYLPAGTRISYYNADGSTLLYTYRTVATEGSIQFPFSPRIYDDATSSSSSPNTGNVPFGLGPVYIDYSPPDRLGATYFEIGLF